MKPEKRIIRFIVSAALLIVTLWFTSCGAATAEAGAERKPCYHVKVYSPAIENAGYASRRRPKYTITRSIPTENVRCWMPKPKPPRKREPAKANGGADR